MIIVSWESEPCTLIKDDRFALCARKARETADPYGSPSTDSALTAHRFVHFVHTRPLDEPVMYLHFIGEETIGADELGKLPRNKEQAFDATQTES